MRTIEPPADTAPVASPRVRFRDARIEMAHGAGGKASRRLIEGLPEDDPVRREGELQIRRLEELAQHSGDPRGGTGVAH